MKNIVLVYFLFASFCVSNHAQVTPTRKNEKLITIDLDRAPVTDAPKLSTIFKPAKTILLETNENCLIGQINALQVFDDYLFVLDVQLANSLFVFNREGKFIRKIGSIGKGPGEYSSVADFTIDPDKKEIYLLDFNTRKIHQYTLEGAYLRTITPLCDARIKSILYHNGALFTEVKSHSAANDCMLQKMDPEYGSCEASYLSTAQYNLGWNEFYYVNTITGFYGKTGRSPKFVQLFMDTVMTVRQGAIIPYLVVQSKDWISAGDLKNADQEDPYERHKYLSMQKNISLNIQNYMENEKVIFFTYEIGDRRSRKVLYDKNNDTTIIGSLRNDLVYVENGMDVKFHFYNEVGAYHYITTSELGYFIGEIEKNKLKPDLDKYEQLKGLTEESNPVVFYYEYR